MKWVKDGLYHHHFVNNDGEILATVVKQYGDEKVLWGQREFLNLNAAKKVVEKEFGRKI